jgi:hypothetical protein
LVNSDENLLWSSTKYWCIPMNIQCQYHADENRNVYRVSCKIERIEKNDSMMSLRSLGFNHVIAVAADDWTMW